MATFIRGDEKAEHEGYGTLPGFLNKEDCLLEMVQ
jgi:hypothetical protein